MPSEPIATPAPTTAESSLRCASCGAPMGTDQRYCLECGERQLPSSAFLASGGPVAAASKSPPPAPPASAAAPPPDGSRSPNALTLIAGVGVLMLAMGVGVLIGRAGASRSNAGAGAGHHGRRRRHRHRNRRRGRHGSDFTGDWPSGTSGYTVQLQTLPVAGTSVSAVEAAKSAATTKGAKGVGALKSEEFSSLPSGDYVIYSGVETSKAQADKALAGLKAKFPGAKVIHVATGASSGSEAQKASGSSSSASSGAGSSPTHPAPPSVLENLQKSKGKSYEEKSKNLPNSVET